MAAAMSRISHVIFFVVSSEPSILAGPVSANNRSPDTDHQLLHKRIRTELRNQLRWIFAKPNADSDGDGGAAAHSLFAVAYNRANFATPSINEFPDPLECADGLCAC